MANGHNLLVSFELADPLDNYERLARTLASLGPPVKIGAMLWYLDSARTAREAEAALRPALGPGDTMVVVDASSNFAILHNLSVAGAQVRRCWNMARGAPAAARPDDGTTALRPPAQ